MAMMLLSFTILTLFISSSASALHKDLTKNFTNKELGGELSTTAISSNTKEEFSSVNYSFPNSSALPVTTDSDGDGVLDMNDLDDDNDGILDTDEQDAPCTYSGGTDFSTLTYTNNSSVNVSTLSSNSISVNRINGGWVSTYSNQTFALPLRLEFTLDNVSSPSMIGLIGVTKNKVPTSWTDQSHKFYFANGSIYEIKDFAGSCCTTTYAANDKFYIEIDENGNLLMGQNDVVTYTDIVNDSEFQLVLGSASTTPAKPFYNMFLASNPSEYASCQDRDTDADGTIDRLDLDSDGDGCNDVSEAGLYDPNLDGILGGASVTVDAQGRVTSGSGAYTGTRIFVTDFTCSDIDSDGVIDRFDLDDDNDGILDTDEQTSNCSLRNGTDFTNLTFTNNASVQVNAVTNDSIRLNRISGGWVSTYSDQTFTLPLRLEFTVDNVSSLSLIGLIGLTKTKTPSSWADQSHKFYFASGSTYALRDFGAGCCTATYAPNDNFYIQIDELGNLTMARNNTVLYTDVVDDTKFQLVFTTGSTAPAKPFYNLFLASDYEDYYACDDIDTDSDGLVNRLDLDSDGDGCFDIAEAGFEDPNSDGVLGGSPVTVDTEGRVTSAANGYTGTSSSVIDSSCSDTDSDGIIDAFDLDDDNDGILDADEDVCSTNYEFTFSGVANVNDVGSIDNLYLSEGNSAGNWWEGVFFRQMNEYFSSYPNIAMHPFFTSEDWFYVYAGTYGGSATELSISFDTRCPYADNGATWIMRAYKGTGFTPGQNVNITGLTQFYSNTIIFNIAQQNQQFQIPLTGLAEGEQIFIYWEVDTNNSIYHAGMDNILINIAEVCDTDEDGIPNSLDLDSDGDGCFDALEAGFFPNLVDVNGELTGSVDGTGISLNAGGGASLSPEVLDPALQSDYCCGFSNSSLDCDGDGYTNAEEYAGICGVVGDPFDINSPVQRWETTASTNSNLANFKLEEVANITSITSGIVSSLKVKTGHTLTLTSNLTLKDLVLESGSAVELNGHTISLSGDLFMDGQIDLSEGGVVFSGACGEQKLNSSSGIRLHDLTIDNGNLVTLETDIEVTGVLRAESGTLNINNKTLKLVSEEVNGTVQTGSIGEIKSGADIIGEISIQRYVASLEDGYRLLGAPIKNLTVADISDDFVTTGFSGSDWPNHYFTNLKYYDEDGRINGDVHSGFKDVANVTDPLLSNQGYWAYFPPSNTANLLEVDGEFNKGEVTYNLSYTDTGVPQADGWHCIINPYPSAIDLDSPCITFNNVSPAVYILDHTIGGTWKGEYVAYNDGVSVNGGTKEVASFQAFMVQATGPGASIVFNECAKTDVQGTFYRSGEAEKPLIRLAMKNTEAHYETVIAFDDQATAIFDPEKDARRWQSVMFSLATVAGEDTLAINNLPLDSEGIEIPIIISAPEAGTFALEITEVTDLETQQCLYIEDLLTGEVISIREGEEISFTVGEANYYEERFIIRSRQIAEVSSNSPLCSGEESGLVQITLADERTSDIKWFTQDNELIHSTYGGFSELDSLPAGSYYAEVEDPGGICGTTVFEIDIIQTEQQIIELASTPDYCSEGYAEISVNVTESEEWTVTLLQDYKEVARETSGSELLFTGLKGMVYDLIVESECIREEYVLDLTDPDAVESYFESPNELLIEQLNEGLEVEALSINAEGYEWFLNEYYKGDSDVISLTFDEVGVHTLKLNSFNEHCQDEYSQDIMVSAASIIEENLEKDFLTVNKENTFEIIRLNDQSGRIDVILFDVTGKVVAQELQSEKETLTIEKGNLASGIYILEIRTETGIVLSKKYSK